MLFEAFSYHLTPAVKREIKKIIYPNFDLIVEIWINTFKNSDLIEPKSIESLAFEGGQLHLLVNGRVLEITIKNVSKKLENATEMERAFFKVSPSGYGIHWPLIDEDLSLEALIAEYENRSVKATDL